MRLQGWLEIQRQRIHPFTVLDDHSRFLLALRPCTDLTMATAWNAFWDVLGEFGLPEELLCDNAFGSCSGHVRTISWFEARLLRLGIKPRHGRPYHPQTQGKLERLHGTLVRELWPHARRDSLDHFAADLQHWRTQIYNPIRPHEAIGDRPPLHRWRPSPRPRPTQLPLAHYPPGALLRKVASGGDITWNRYRILVGQGIAKEFVQLEEIDADLVVSYAGYPFRRLPLANLRHGVIL